MTLPDEVLGLEMFALTGILREFGRPSFDVLVRQLGP